MRFELSKSRIDGWKKNMIPILFEKTETSFTTNGLGRLIDCISCIVTEERNGIYECEFEYPVTGRLFPYIQEGRIVACTHDEQGDLQPFDIYAKSEPINGVVTFRARHISYRLNEITAKPFTAGSCAQALAALPNNSVGTNPFTFWTDKSVTADFISDVPRKIRNLLGGEENSILDVFGTGEYEFDKFTVKFHLHRGQDTNVSIRYGKNLIDYLNDYDAGETYTAVVPYWIGTVSDDSGGSSVSSTEIVTLPEWYISSGHSVPGGREVIVPMDLSPDFDTKPSVSDLRSKATSRLNSSDAWVPNQTMTVDFIQLWQTEEYKDYAPLQRLKLCDTCGVFVPMYNTSVRVKVIKVVYNALLDRYDSMELGDKPATYSAVIEKDYASKVADIMQGFQSIAIDIQNVEENAKSYTDGEISGLKEELETQIDAKIETWAQSSNPATAWTTAELRAEHNGDLWLYTGTSDTTVGGVTIHPQGVYQYNGSTNAWAAYSSTSNNLFDLADGKCTIFYGTTSGTYSNKQTGDYLVDNTDGSTYRWSGTAWVKQTDYASAITSAINALKTDLETQIDAKIETWAQSADPATSWTTAELKSEHNGDLWLYTGTSDITVGGVTIHPQGTYKYVKGTGNTGSWTAHSSTSGNLFDLADGKTTIFYGPPTGTYNDKQTGDYLVDNTDGSTYRWSGTAWVKQTDYAGAIASAAQTITGAYEQAISDATDLICGGTGGYIITTLNADGKPIELLITDNLDINQAVNVWRWNSGGLGHSSNGYAGPFSDIAITQDGKINASMILTGALSANIITAGVLKDANSKVVFDLDAGTLAITKGSINLGSGNFIVTDAGALTAKSGVIASFTIGTSGLTYTSGSNTGSVGNSGIYFQDSSRRTRMRSYSLEIGKISGGSYSYIGELQGYNDDGIWLLGKKVYLAHRSSASAAAIANVTVNTSGNVSVYGDFSVNGTKSRQVKTDDYSDRLLYCYETPTPIFGDIGEATIDEDGFCYVDLDDIFSETIEDTVEYQVFLQKEGEGDCWVAGKAPRYFVIQGTPGLRVAWELKAKQKDYRNIRLEQGDLELDEYEHDLDDLNLYEEYINEQEGLLYG